MLVIAAAAAVMLAALVAAWKLLPAYTVEGRRLDDEIEGLRQYLSVAEGDDLARMKMPPRTKEEFAKFLPYAVALEVEQTWADAFAAVLGASALAAATAGYYASSSGSSSMSGSARRFRELARGHGPHHQRRVHPAGQQLGQLGRRRQQQRRRGRFLGRRRRRRRRQRVVSCAPFLRDPIR